MSYVVKIVRQLPITETELRSFVADKPNLKLLPDVILILDANGDPKLPITRESDHLWSTPRNDGEFAIMQDLAEKLGAKLIGEEGEDMSASPEKKGCGSQTALILLLAPIIAQIAWS